MHCSSKGAEWDIFISYASPDRPQAKQLCSAILAIDPQIRLFLDIARLKPGSVWPDVLDKAQRNSRMTAVLLSSNTKNAYWQMAEVVRAIKFFYEHGRQLIPILLDDKAYRPFGTEPLQFLNCQTLGGLNNVAREVVRTLRDTERLDWADVKGVLQIQGSPVAYLPILNDLTSKPTLWKMKDISFLPELEARVLDPTFANASLRIDTNHISDLPSCGLGRIEHGASPFPVRFGRTSYLDYIRSSEILDDPVPGQRRTYRNVLEGLTKQGVQGLFSPQLKLSNICGTGTFIVSELDRSILITKHSLDSHVYPGRWTFSASGTMKWGASPHPFTEALVKCREELNHQMNLKNTSLIAFGADARKLFFQFSFVEFIASSSKDLIQQIKDAEKLKLIKTGTHELISIAKVESIVEELIARCWEPSAEVTLLAIAIRRFGMKSVFAAIEQRRDEWHHKRMQDEWDFRANAPGLLPVMSVRYPRLKLHRLSQQFIAAVMKFIGNEVSGKRVLEIGCGLGRFTCILAKKARHVVAVDLCERMLEKCEEAVSKAKLSSRVSSVRAFAQQYKANRADIAMCCLVLIHNTKEEDFEALVEMMCNAAPVVFVFEDITAYRKTSSHTRIRDRKIIKEAFNKRDFIETGRRPKTFRLDRDNIIFMRFQKAKVFPN